MLEPSRHDVEAEVEEVPQHRLQVEAFGPTDLGRLGRDEARQVDREGDLQRRVLEQVRHHHLLVGVPLDVELDPHIVGGQVADVEEGRQAALDDDLGDPFDEGGLVDGVGNARDDERFRRSRGGAVDPGGAQAYRTRACAIDLLQLVGRVEDLAAGREVRPLDVAAQLGGGEVGVVNQLDQGRADLAEVVGGHVGGHPDGNPCRAVDEEVRDARGQHHGFGARAVVVGPERDRILCDLAQQFVAQPRQPAFGVAHRGGVVAVERPEVARALDEGVSQGEGLREADQRVVDGGVAVRVVGAHHVADDLGALARLCVGREVLLPHREEDAALDRLEAVAHVGQGPRRDDRERVIEVALLGGLVQGDRRLRRGRPASRGTARRGGRGRVVRGGG